MKRTMLALAALVAGVVVGCGGTKEARRDVAAVTPGVEDRQEGVVSSVEEGAISVTSADRPFDPPVRFKLDQRTRVKRGEEALDRTAIQEGAVVRVSFESRAGDEQAKAVELLEGDEAAQIRARASSPPPAWPKPERNTSSPVPQEARDPEVD